MTALPASRLSASPAGPAVNKAGGPDGLELILGPKPPFPLRANQVKLADQGRTPGPLGRGSWPYCALRLLVRQAIARDTTQPTNVQPRKKLITKTLPWLVTFRVTVPVSLFGAVVIAHPMAV
jgi:hypothetical protein